ncbi:MAG: hypothetical protein ACREMY_00785, partial [bacterium]
AQEGATLTAMPVIGGDSDDAAATVHYQWQSSDGGSFSAGHVVPIGSDSATYLVTEADENSHIRVVASFTDDTSQTVTAASTPTAAVLDNSSLAVTVSGTAQEGATLTATPLIGGDSDDAAATVHYQWQSSDDGSFSAGHVVPIGSDSATYQVTEADENSHIRAVASFTDDTSQTVTAASTPTAAVIDITPTLTASVTGTAAVGQTLTAVAAANDDDVTFSYQWRSSTDNGGHWSSISGAIASSYVMQPSDNRHELRVEVTSVDTDGGGTTADSAGIVISNELPTVTVVRQRRGSSKPKVRRIRSIQRKRSGWRSHHFLPGEG